MKPFSIISSAVIQSEIGALKGTVYNSDLRGSQPSGGGFEVTISTDQFQQYVRNNSNYVNMFELQKQELQKQHEVERKNERVSQAVNTISAITMGAIGGGSAGGKIGAGISGAAAGLTVGIAMNKQYNANEELRKYEEQLLQQRFDLEIGTIKNLPNSISRISSFNNIIMQDFHYIIEEYQCSSEELDIVDIFIEKNIPISAGLAGGSTDAVGTLIGLNELFNTPLSNESLHKLCAQLGSDLNVCLEGGCILATSKGEKIQKLKTIKSPVSLIKPPNLGISAKEAYTKYALKEEKPKYNMTEKMIDAIESGDDIKKFLYNDLEYAVFEDYKELREIKSKYPSAIMSGSGSTYFILENIPTLPGYQTINGLEFIETGCRPV